MDIQRITLEELHNTRDLGGFKSTDGRQIRYKKLIRSGELYRATQNDKIRLSKEYHLKKIIDFRTETERSGKPDPEIDGAVYIADPILKEETLGITRAGEGAPDGVMQLIEMVCSESFDGKAYMSSIYREMISDAQSRAQYRKFFEILLEPSDGAVLWHCSAGKDRVGVGTALLLTALDIPRPLIIEDYLKVNEFAAHATEKSVRAMLARAEKEKNWGTLPETVRASHIRHLKTMFEVDAAYINTVFEMIEQQWGSTGAFLESEMGLDHTAIEKLKTMYMEAVQ